MATITMKEINEILEVLRANGDKLEEHNLAKGMSYEIYESDGWWYKVFFQDGKPAKLEAYNHSVFEELWVR